ncbi:MAG: glycosyltransferase family 1 protein [Bacteroidota bacterium]
MKIGIEGQRLYRRKKHGMDMVALELIKNLQKIDTHNEYVIFVRPDEDNTCIPKAANFKVVELESWGGYAGWEQFALPKAAFKEGCDVLHCTSNTGPIFSKVPLITTLHDIIYLESISLLKKEGTWYQKLGNMYRRYCVPSVVRKSKKVITVSEYEKERINKHFGFGDQRLTAIYNGVGEHFVKITDAEHLRKVKEQYRLPERFFFFLGNTDPKKNTRGVLKAFAQFNQMNSNTYKLVMLDYDEHELQKLLAEMGASSLRDAIHLTGYVPNTDLPALISQCSVFLYPSLRESFGIPILEGMACGVPVITSNTSSMPEVAGENTALLVDPYYTNAIFEALNTLVEDEALASLLAENGIERAKKFSWETMANNVLQLYENVHHELEKSEA